MGLDKSQGRKRRGEFIVLVGPDGVGKTEVARELTSRRHGRYFHFRPPFRSAALMTSPSSEVGIKEDFGPGPFPLGPIRLVRSVVLFWVGYLGAVLPMLRSGVDVVGDRWAYGYLVQPHALKFSGPDWLSRLAFYFLPEPDLVINLAASPEVVRQRKQELSEEDIEVELEAWAALPARHLVTISAEASANVVADCVERELGT